MTSAKENLYAVFDPAGRGLSPEILDVLESTLRLHSLTVDELFVKWEVYCLKMGSEETKLDLETTRLFAKDVQDGVERGDHLRPHHNNKSGTAVGLKSERKSAVHATPRAVAGGAGDVFGMLDELTPNALGRRNGSVKRKADFESPVPRKVSRPETTTTKTPARGGKMDSGPAGIPFSERQNAGHAVEILNGHLPSVEPPIAPFSEARLQFLLRSDFKKFAYKPMAMHLSDSSEVLDDRIDDFMALIQQAHNLDESAFANAAAQSTSEIVAVGRIASDTPEGKLNSASLVLEMSRRMGAGLRVPLKVDALPSYQFFPGQIVAVRGTNASGLYFTVKEILSAPRLPMPSSTPTQIEAINQKLGVSEDSDSSSPPLNIMIASGPYTAEDNLDFEPFQELCQKAAENMVDALILTGPFLDIEHPMLASGDFDLPDIRGLDQNASMAALFRLWIAGPLQRLCSAVPSITVLIVPSVRDAISKHVSWPQERPPRKDLALPKQVTMLPNPCYVSLNEVVIGISSQDILYELSREQLSHGAGSDLLTRLPSFLIDQRHFFPLFPPMSRDKLSSNGVVKATGACLDVGYLKLGEWMAVKPDVLVLPSILTPSIKVVDGVMIINPGQLSKRKAAGTYSQMTVTPRILSEEEKAERTVLHKVFERARVEVVRI
ncbi:DNA-directed DNA polymerase alpha subunit pol12 [Exophiala dermatitidis]|uniref:DNA polymerase alpha subunit B n=1 Tax=Exophiala dermatitidis TaxID=5970 RepID=A0AAN6EPJ4_EXODE|nr:DNA-directed DNA polymerase alpha subunit pol12 [Exophiala dermatitidis]KAJ4548798.1 DNA-directed DNA polymerase alpha subunit pol12 [Exophiala dermatitidis]KAJ4550586.1 DNA-directed DNA polymerase alpha subunit pol12 [Exophiala dermatitidis]KAJ4652578.1 DNA-directed DNA polymerase alpha subunit pol12 [Exophiala dermatitidis]KAJ4654966.1 DNA-directed DNA polymerase alpha subunit pol12 [Exophiala dermatitidis]